jgi:hypothetical protein
MKNALETAIKLYMNKIELPLASIQCEELGINVDLMTKPTEEEIIYFYGKAVELLGSEVNKDKSNIINKEDLLEWLLGQRYIVVDENSTEMNEDYEREHAWQLSRNSFINKVVNHINGEVRTSEDIVDIRLKGMKGKNLSRLAVETILLNYPGVKIAHASFSKDEYIYSKEDAKVYTEENYLFEDWCSYGAGQHNGMRMRTGGIWEKDWYIKE